jgi:hypothetical protein
MCINESEFFKGCSPWAAHHLWGSDEASSIYLRDYLAHPFNAIHFQTKKEREANAQPPLSPSNAELADLSSIFPIRTLVTLSSNLSNCENDPLYHKVPSRWT